MGGVRGQAEKYIADGEQKKGGRSHRRAGLAEEPAGEAIKEKGRRQIHEQQAKMKFRYGIGKTRLSLLGRARRKSSR